MSVLPDEIWSRILEMGVETKGLSYRDMCCISITCRRFHRLSNDHPLWATLLALDFPSPSLPLPSNNASNIQTTPKSLYKTRFERDRASKRLAHRRAVLIVESQIAICSKNLRDSGLQLFKEKDKMKETVEELANLRKVRYFHSAASLLGFLRILDKGVFRWRIWEWKSGVESLILKICFFSANLYAVAWY
eukprot:TRINITY_DN13512_c0_g1_i5.p1 TRINITY_DN13512_c0_g1~~TRINITY_DN13512_c0_g1_i5.p1  ORF type:complete len:191 (+),score=28.41 TRINITY_DN13512_c0_g1_i5:221-793(+)